MTTLVLPQPKEVPPLKVEPKWTFRHTPLIQFHPKAWLKLLFCLHRRDVEVAGFGIIYEPSDILFVSDFAVFPQISSYASWEWDDEKVADWADQMEADGLEKYQFMRFLIHTHPGASATPSGVDERNFQSAIGGANWSVMFILAKQGGAFARMRFQLANGLGASVPLQANPLAMVRWDLLGKEGLIITEAEQAQWEAEYDENVQSRVVPSESLRGGEVPEAMGFPSHPTTERTWLGGVSQEETTKEQAEFRDAFQFDEDGEFVEFEEDPLENELWNDWDDLIDQTLESDEDGPRQIIQKEYLNG